LTSIDKIALKFIASKAHTGVHCTIPASESEQNGEIDLELAQAYRGGQNCQLDIEFDDGNSWLARIWFASNPRMPPEDTQRQIFSSEIATLKFLDAAGVTVPKVHAHATENGPNSLGLSYMLTDVCPRIACEWQEATPEQKTKIMGQVANIYVQL
jgi:hypothetical protein